MTETPSPSGAPKRSIGRRLLLPALFFGGGLAAAAWLLLGTQAGTSWITPEAPSQLEVNASEAGTGEDQETNDALQKRLADVEARLARAQAGALPAMGGAPASDRITGLVITFAARRAIERGQPLGPVEDELARYFSFSSPHLVASVAAYARKPVPLATIKADFETLVPALSGESDGLWTKISSDIGDLFTVRTRDKPPTDRQLLITRARASLGSGNVGDALDVITKLPNRGAAAEWLAAARRYSEAQKALDELENLAFAGPSAPAPVVPPATILPDAPLPPPPPQIPLVNPKPAADF